MLSFNLCVMWCKRIIRLIQVHPLGIMNTLLHFRANSPGFKQVTKNKKQKEKSGHQDSGQDSSCGDHEHLPRDVSAQNKLKASRHSQTHSVSDFWCDHSDMDLVSHGRIRACRSHQTWFWVQKENQLMCDWEIWLGCGQNRPGKLNHDVETWLWEVRKTEREPAHLQLLSGQNVIAAWFHIDSHRPMRAEHLLEWENRRQRNTKEERGSVFIYEGGQREETGWGREEASIDTTGACTSNTPLFG